MAIHKVTFVYLLTCAGLLAQEEPITRATVNQIRSDAVVTDRHGNAVTDLGPDDFRVFQDRKQQTPVHVEYVPGRVRRAGSAMLPVRELKREDV
jgi:hypothetical protein